jgi:hypothetical protein
MNKKLLARTAATVLGIAVLCAISLPLKSDEDVHTVRSILKFRLKDRIASLSTDATGSAYSSFPTVTMWYFAEITRVQISGNPASVVVDDDFVRGTVLMMNSDSGLPEKREFEIQFDSNGFPPASLGGFEAGMGIYIGVTKKNQLFDIYYPARESRKR